MQIDKKTEIPIKNESKNAFSACFLCSSRNKFLSNKEITMFLHFPKTTIIAISSTSIVFVLPAGIKKSANQEEYHFIATQDVHIKSEFAM